MKILLLNHSDSGGGAVVAALRLLNGLREYGLEAKLGVATKTMNNPNVICLRKKQNFLIAILGKICRKLYNLRLAFFFQTTNPILHSENKDTLLDIDKINNSDYDLIHLHWINYNTISIEDIAKIKKPIVWTMHDFWPFSGAEHYPNVLENEQRYKAGYTKENKSFTTQGIDICRQVWKRKRKSWRNLRLDFISPSNYEKKCFDESALFRGSGNVCTVIPNIVPENIFRPLNKSALRKKYNVPKEKKVIGFGALNISDKKSIKGGYLLLEALRKMPNPQEYHLVIFGNVDENFSQNIPISVYAAGYTKEPEKMVELYNLCDVYVCPSIIESFGLTCLEAIFCGVPVAAFNTGGIPDIVEHENTGYLAKPFEVDDLCNGILYCFDDKARLAENALQKARRDFNNKDVIEKHILFYKNILK